MTVQLKNLYHPFPYSLTLERLFDGNALITVPHELRLCQAAFLWYTKTAHGGYVRAIPLALITLVLAAPGNAQDKASNSGEENSAGNQSAAHSFLSSVVKPDAPKGNKEKLPGIADQDVERRVRIAAPVTVSTPKDHWDKGLVICTFLLVIVGGFQIWFLWRTVRATSDNATAARLAAEAQINAERAWIVPTIRYQGFQGTALEAPIIVEFRNGGRTPAWVIERGAKLVTVRRQDAQGLKEHPSYDFLTKETTVLTNSNDSFAQIVMFMSAGELIEVGLGNMSLYVYGCAKYRLVFGAPDADEPPCETRFCYELRVYTPSDLMPTGFYISGPKAYNRYT
jgi:hypothetical protein